MLACPENWVAIGCAVIYYARVACSLSAGIKCRHCGHFLLFFKLHEEYAKMDFVTLVTRGKSENVFASILKRQREIYGELSLVQQALQRVIVRNQVASIHQD